MDWVCAQPLQELHLASLAGPLVAIFVLSVAFGHRPEDIQDDPNNNQVQAPLGKGLGTL